MHELNDRFVSLLAGEFPTLRDAGMILLGSRGKRLRPLLLLLTCASLGDITDRSQLFASLIELIHTASLAHDDVVDEAALRRGAPSAPARWGNKFSILLGDYLLARVFEQATLDGDLHILHLLANSSVEMGRAVVLECSGLNIAASEDLYWDVVHGKTASLFSTAAEIGSVIGGATTEQQQAMRRMGWSFGCAFQLADDLMDLQGVEEELGKPVGSDWQQQRATLPLLYAMRTAPADVAAEIRALFHRDPFGAEELTALRILVESSGGFDYAWQKVKEYREDAYNQLSCLPVGAGRDALVHLCSDAFPMPMMPTT